MRSLIKVKTGVGIAAVVVISIFLVSIASSEVFKMNYQIGDLMVTFPQTPGLPGGLKPSGWQIIKADKNELILKIMTFEPVVRRYEFITHELIIVSCQPETGVVADKKNINYPLPRKDKLTNILGLMLQKFLKEGFEIGKGSSFTKVAGVDAYKFELIRPKIPLQQWLEGKHIKYAWHIVFWKKNWYLMTYCNFDNAFAGPHFPDFEMLLRHLKFAKQNSNHSARRENDERRDSWLLSSLGR